MVIGHQLPRLAGFWLANRTFNILKMMIEYEEGNGI